MPQGMRHPEPHENGDHSGYPDGWHSRLDQGRFVSGASSPIMSLAWTSCEPEPVAPVNPGSTKSSLLPLPPCLPVPRGRQESRAMEILYQCCAGLDVHKRTVVACIRRLGPD